MKFHKLSEIFPLIPDDELKAMAADIKSNGQREPIITYEGQILDGRNRWRACQIAGVDPKLREYSGETPISFVISLNLHRRHLDTGQRACVAVEIEPLLAKEAAKRVGGRPKAAEKPVAKLPPVSDKSRDKAGALMGVSGRSVSTAKKIQEESPEDFAAVKSGLKRLSEAVRDQKKREHSALVQSVAQKPKIATTGPFDVILADPPWRYEHCEADNREIENHYTTATIDDICKHSPNSADDCILLMWTTAPKLLEAFTVIERWGFTYRTGAVWDKEVIGMGYWFRVQHEHLLVAVKGKPKCPPDSERISSVIRSARQKHSQKPEAIRDWIERAFPAAAKLEMYCRSPRDGWAVFGNEVA